jgi:hypothetical protein
LEDELDITTALLPSREDIRSVGILRYFVVCAEAGLKDKPLALASAALFVPLFLVVGPSLFVKSHAIASL